VKEDKEMNGSPHTLAILSSSESKNFPSTGTTFSSGSNSENRVEIRSWKPLKTDRVHINANDARAIPAADIAEITLMTLWLFFA
jgi:hypothetical protein